jgi:hypothetical protein
MTTPSRFIAHECRTISKIIADEQWLEGERRGQPVPANDPVVLGNVCAVVMRIGAAMREQAEKEQS